MALLFFMASFFLAPLRAGQNKMADHQDLHDQPRLTPLNSAEDSVLILRRFSTQ